jgi:hypothetical protein
MTRDRSGPKRATRLDGSFASRAGSRGVKGADEAPETGWLFVLAVMSFF